MFVEEERLLDEPKYVCVRGYSETCLLKLGLKIDNLPTGKWKKCWTDCLLNNKVSKFKLILCFHAFKSESDKSEYT